MKRIAHEKQSIEEMQKAKDVDIAYCVHVIHPRKRKKKQYIPETGEVIEDSEEYGKCIREIEPFDKHIKQLDMLIEDTNIEK